MVTTASDFKDHGVERAAAGGRRGAIGKIHDHADRPGLRRADVLRQGRHDRAAHHERDDGSGDARGGDQHAHFHDRGPVAGRKPRRDDQYRRRRAAPKCAPIFRFPPLRISTGACAKCRTCRRSGATSIRSCCTAGISASRAISKSCWPSAIRKRWSCFTRWKK